MATQLHTATAQGAIEYLDSLVAKNRAPASVVSPLKTALTKVLQRTEGEQWGKTDLIDLDVGDIMMRFKQLSLTEYSEGSYRTYEMRLKKAIEWYLKFLQSPGWAPPEAAHSVAARSKPNDRFEANPAALEHPAVQDMPTYRAPETPVAYVPKQSVVDTVAYPFPLESGKMANLNIPKDITAGDVERLHTFLNALVINKEGGGET
jgi:hypothetical protein